MKRISNKNFPTQVFESSNRIIKLIERKPRNTVVSILIKVLMPGNIKFMVSYSERWKESFSLARGVRWKQNRWIYHLELNIRLEQKPPAAALFDSNELRPILSLTLNLYQLLLWLECNINIHLVVAYGILATVPSPRLLSYLPLCLSFAVWACFHCCCCFRL